MTSRNPTPGAGIQTENQIIVFNGNQTSDIICKNKVPFVPNNPSDNTTDNNHNLKRIYIYIV